MDETVRKLAEGYFNVVYRGRYRLGIDEENEEEFVLNTLGESVSDDEDIALKASVRAAVHTIMRADERQAADRPAH